MSINSFKFVNRAFGMGENTYHHWVTFEITQSLLINRPNPSGEQCEVGYIKFNSRKIQSGLRGNLCYF